MAQKDIWMNWHAEGSAIYAREGKSDVFVLDMTSINAINMSHAPEGSGHCVYDEYRRLVPTDGWTNMGRSD